MAITSTPKVASLAVELAAKMIVKKHGQERLESGAKLHFKTIQAVLASVTGASLHTHYR